MSRRHSHSHSLQPLPRSLTAHAPTRRRGVFADAWSRLDRVQELGERVGDVREGHNGCVNALSWSDDGATLLSGSDDKRICIWTPDTRTDAPAAQFSPHPLKLSGMIITGHRANIFSSRFLPNSGTPTIVSCAGDGDIRVFNVERLQSADGVDMPPVRRPRGALWGVDGPGVRVLRCHRDRTKRIATEASPFLFLTVSEDGTVRQHDLRRPHTCRDECPDPLFQAPPLVDLYSLSVSPLTPHLFAVAGQTDCAYICDRRKPEHQTPSWGKHTKRAEQVTCVRRLALPQAEWESVEHRNDRERHITCVKMSADNAGEVICAFARHSTSLFSLNDSPAESSARVRHASVVPPNPDSNTRKADRKRDEKRRDAEGEGKDEEDAEQQEGSRKKPPEGVTQVGRAEGATRPRPGTGAPKRRISSVSRPESRPGETSRQRTNSTEPDEAREERAARFLRSPSSSPPQELAAISSSPQPRDRRPLGAEWEEGPDEVMDLSQFAQEMEDGSEPRSDLDDVVSRTGPAREEMDIDDDDIDSDDDEEALEESETEESDDDDSSHSDADLYPDSYSVYHSGALSSDGEFKSVEVLYPRRSFRGARNVATVKDCNFLGDGSDKVASGSDDGNWFVWDKETGRLEGIWRGDGETVNVMEQHPTLPVVAVSGIDKTVKIFAPVTRHPDPSFNRTSDADRIIERNLSRSAPRQWRMLADVSAIQLLMMLRNQPDDVEGGRRDAVLDLFRSSGIVRIVGDDDDDDDDGSRMLAVRDPDADGDDSDDEDA